MRPNTSTLSETIITTKSGSNKNEKVKQIITSNSVWLDRKIEEATVGLRPEFSRDLHSISEENASYNSELHSGNESGD